MSQRPISRSSFLPAAFGALALSVAPPLARAQLPGAPAPAGAAPSTTETYHPNADGFVSQWLVLAPIFYDPLWPSGELELDKSQLGGEGGLKPKEGAKAKAGDQERTWTKHKSGDALIDLAAATGVAQTRYQLGYAVTYVVADAAVKGAKLRLGTDDLAKVYWNGKMVARSAKTVGGAAKRDAFGAFVDIRKGVNVLVVKVINDEAKWGLFTRLVGEGGKPVPGLKVTTAPDGKGDSAVPDTDGFLRDWLVFGPVPYKPRSYAQGQLARQQVPDEAKLAPRVGAEIWVDGQPQRWVPWSSGSDGVLDFNAYILTHKRLVPPGRWEPNSTVFNPLGYAVAYVHAAEDVKDARVRLGVNDVGLVYVNGKKAAVWDEPGALVKDKAEGKVTLKKGVNVIVLKVVNSGDAWQGAVRLVDKDGKPLTGLDVKLAPPPSPADAPLAD